jgi:hypothetical protein
MKLNYSRFPIAIDRFVGAVNSGQLPERGEFGRLAEADFKYNVFVKTTAVGKMYSSSKKGGLNRFLMRHSFSTSYAFRRL